MLFIISYDLNKPGQNYSELFDAIKSCGAWWHHLDSTWILSSSFTASKIAEKLRTKIDKNDSLLVIKITKDYDGWLPDKAWKWIKNH